MGSPWNLMGWGHHCRSNHPTTGWFVMTSAHACSTSPSGRPLHVHASGGLAAGHTNHYASSCARCLLLSSIWLQRSFQCHKKNHLSLHQWTTVTYGSDIQGPQPIHAIFPLPHRPGSGGGPTVPSHRSITLITVRSLSTSLMINCSTAIHPRFLFQYTQFFWRAVINESALVLFLTTHIILLNKTEYNYVHTCRNYQKNRGKTCVQFFLQKEPRTRKYYNKFPGSLQTTKSETAVGSQCRWDAHWGKRQNTGKLKSRPTP